MSLFVRKNFISHSGKKLSWKIEAEGLDMVDLDTLANIVAKRFHGPEIVGIPTGGLRFAKLIQEHKGKDYKPDTWSDGRPVSILLVDDVMTTGQSLIDMRQQLKDQRELITDWGYQEYTEFFGVVIFSRMGYNRLHWVTPIFELNTNWIDE